MDPIVLPAVNASLNATATVLLLIGRARVRRGNIAGHRRAMLQAFAVSSAFLVLYVLHKASRGFENTPYNGEGWLQAFYLGMLASHVLLAMTVPVLAVLLIRFGLGGRIAQHRRLARLAWPIWLYVSVTGVAIFLMLYPFNPAPV